MAKQNKPEKETGKSNSKQFTRREFLGASGAVIAVTALSSSLLNSCKGTSSTSTTSTTSSPSSNIFRIGVLTSLTGSGASSGVLSWQECQLIAQYINKGGWLNQTPGLTVNGKQYTVELNVEDIQSNADGTQAAATKMVYEDNIKFIAGPQAPFESASSGVTEPAKVLRVLGISTGTPSEFSADTPYTFDAHNGSIEHVFFGIRYMKDKYPNTKNVVIVTADDGSVQYLVPRINDQLATYGMTQLGNIITYPNDIVDFSPISAQIMSRNPDGCVIANAYYVHMGAILKLIRGSGSMMPVGSGSPAGGEDVITIAGTAASTNFFSTGITEDNLTDPNSPPILISIINDLRAAYGSQRTILLQEAQSIWEICEAVQGAQSFDPTAVKNYWASLSTIGTLYGVGTLGGLKTYGLKQAVSHVEPIMLLENGQVKSGGYYGPGAMP